MQNNYEIFAGSERIEITATRNEAKAYAFGMSEAFRMMGRDIKVKVYNIETGCEVMLQIIGGPAAKAGTATNK